MSEESKFIDMVETILVSGATGTVGSEVVRQLSSSTDVNIKAAARSVEKIKNLEGDKVKAVPVDYNKPESLKEALKNVDKLFLLLLMYLTLMNLHLIWSMKQKRLKLYIL
jgi:saccharopine dehydrogenase-like NADP-dependent oxidoreductase